MSNFNSHIKLWMCVLFTFCIADCFAQDQNLIASWSFDDTGGTTLEAQSNSKDSIHYVFHKHKPYAEPLRKKGIIGTSLNFDGFSTWIERASESFPLPLKEFSISVWVAPRAFEHGDATKLSAIINQQDISQKKGFSLGIFRHGSWSFQVGTGENWIELWAKDHPLPRRKWSHIVAVFDAGKGVLKLYLNGELVAKKSIDKDIAIEFVDEPLIIGKHNQSEIIRTADGELPLNMFNGLMDELNVYDRALSQKEVKKSFQVYLDHNNRAIPEISYEDIKISRSKFKDAPHRPEYHAMPPGNWMNEPHAPFFFNGKYHLTYQHNPTGPYWHQIHWGHWVSDDMVHWKDVPEAIFPENDTIRPDGIWSGAAFFDENNLPVLAYTFGNWSKELNQGIAFSYPKNPQDPDLVEWYEDPYPMITQKKGQGLQGEFRDPFVWRDKENGTWYMLVGSGIEGKGGTAWFYTSEDIKNWKLEGPFYLSNYKEYPFLGTIWELPVFLPIGKYENGETRYIMIISPKGDHQNVEVYYWLGKFDKKQYKFVPDFEEPQYFNYGEGTYIGPSGFIDPESGRAILYTIAAGGHGPGWAGNVSLPIQMTLDQDGKLNIEPISELEGLRKKELLSLKNVSVDHVNEKLEGIKAELLEIELEVELPDKTEFNYDVLKSGDGREYTRIYYNDSTHKLGINTDHSSLIKNSYQHKSTDRRMDKKGHFKLRENENLKLHIYLDKSLIEVFVNKRNSITKWSYPSLPDSKAMEIRTENDRVIIKNITIWELNSIWDENN